MKDSDIRRTTASDPEAAPILDANWFRKAKIVLPEPKQPCFEPSSNLNDS